MVLAKELFGLRGRTLAEGTHVVTVGTGSAGSGDGAQHMEFVPFSASTRMSGVNAGTLELRKGAGDAVSRWVREHHGEIPVALNAAVEGIATVGGTPLVVAESDNGTARVLGVIYLKDVVKGGMRERFDELRQWASARS